MYIKKKKSPKCAVCGEECRFYNLDDYVYKTKLKKDGKRTKYYCGWNCMRKAQKEDEEKERSKKKRRKY